MCGRDRPMPPCVPLPAKEDVKSLALWAFTSVSLRLRCVPLLGLVGRVTKDFCLVCRCGAQPLVPGGWVYNAVLALTGLGPVVVAAFVFSTRDVRRWCSATFSSCVPFS